MELNEKSGTPSMGLIIHTQRIYFKTRMEESPHYQKTCSFNLNRQVYETESGIIKAANTQLFAHPYSKLTVAIYSKPLSFSDVTEQTSTGQDKTNTETTAVQEYTLYLLSFSKQIRHMTIHWLNYSPFQICALLPRCSDSFICKSHLWIKPLKFYQQ